MDHPISSASFLSARSDPVLGKHYIFSRIRLSASRRYTAARQFCILDRRILKQ